MDFDLPLECGCLAAWDHGAWSPDLSEVSPSCWTHHSLADVFAAADAAL